jgi:hypothetical protein
LALVNWRWPTGWMARLDARLCATPGACHKAVRFARQVPGWLPEALRLHGTADWLAGTVAAHKRWREPGGGRGCV